MKKPTVHALIMCLLPISVLANEPIKIGLNFPRTGNYKAEGLELRQGSMLAIEQINHNGGVLGRPLQLLSKNSASRAEKAQRNVDEFFHSEAKMIFGGATSEEAIAAGRRARELGLLYFALLSYANEVTGREGHRYIFRESNNDWMSAQVLGEYLSWHMPRQRYHYIISDDTWGLSMETALRLATASQDRAKHSFTRLNPVNASHTEYKQALTKAQKSQADILVLVLQGQNVMRAMRVAHAMGLNNQVQIIIPNLSRTLIQNLGPQTMTGVIGSQAWNWRVPALENSEKGSAFVKDYTQRYSEYPGSAAASAYSVVYQWADAVQRSKSLESEDIIKALEDHSYQLLKGPQQWRGFDHQNVQDIYAVRVKSRAEIMQDPLKQDYFEIIHRMQGRYAVQSLDDWHQERGEYLHLD